MVSALDRELWVTQFPNVLATTKYSEFISLRALGQRALDTEAATKDDLPLIKLCSFGEKKTAKHSLRHDRNINEAYGLELDYDAERLSPEDIADALRRHNIAGLVVTSPSHRDEAPRARILLPFSTPLRPEVREHMASRVAGIIPDDLAPESWTLSQAYYLGRIADAPAHRVLEVEGDYIDLRPDLDASAKPKPAPAKKAAAKRNGVNGAHAHTATTIDPSMLPVDADAALDAVAAGDGSHDSLVRLAGRWVVHGMPQADIVAALANALYRRPEADRDAGWQQAMDDLPRLVRWVYEQEEQSAAASVPPPPPPPSSSDAASPDAPDPPPELDIDATPAQPYSDDALALAFAQQHADGWRHVAVWGKWYAWSGAVWEEEKTLRVFSRTRLLLRHAAASCKRKRTAASLTDAGTIAAVERLARSDRRLAATVEQWDQRASLLNTPGGVVDLHTGHIHPHRLDDYSTKIAAVAPGGACPTWLAFLDRITGQDKELQAFMKRAAGYCLTGETNEHVLFFGHGTGRNGKGTFLNTLAAVMGSYAVTAGMETFTHSAADQHPCDLAMLRGARLVSAQETERGRRWAESRIKALTGGDPITARFMRQDFFTYLPAFKLFIMGNHKPGLRSVDEAMRARLRLVPFTVTIPPHERDLHLAEKLQAEWPGILAWALEGCLEWRQIGLAPPPAVILATDAYLDSEDLVQTWISECCEAGKNKAAYSAALYSSYSAWAQLGGEFVPTQRWLTGVLIDRGFQKARDMRGAKIIGLALKTGAGSSPPQQP